MTLLEDFVADLSSRRFLREFTFDKNAFHRDAVGTLEAADHIVWLDDLLFIFQLKERTVGTGSLTSWLQRKVLKKATKQVRDTLAIAKSPRPVWIQNRRGHRFDFTQAQGAHAFKLVLFRLPVSMIQVPGPRYHVSRSAGFIHILNWVDYQEIVKYLVTPIEIADYLGFREGLLAGRLAQDLPSEGALIGQFLVDGGDGKPSEHYAGALLSMVDACTSFDLNPFFDGIAPRIEYQTGGPTSYYTMLAELAKLARTELAHLKQRLSLALVAAREDRFERPYRFVSPRTDCGFLILPLTRDLVSKRFHGLGNLSRAAKYDQRSSRQVGISIVCEGDEVLVDWCFIENPWIQDATLEAALKESYPFRPLRSAMQPRYLFRTQDLELHGLVDRPPAASS